MSGCNGYAARGVSRLAVLGVCYAFVRVEPILVCGFLQARCGVFGVASCFPRRLDDIRGICREHRFVVVVAFHGDEAYAVFCDLLQLRKLHVVTEVILHLSPCQVYGQDEGVPCVKREGALQMEHCILVFIHGLGEIAKVDVVLVEHELRTI